MVGKIDIQAKVNNKFVPANKMGDPFDLAAFPGAVDASKGRTLEKLGKEISIVTRVLAKADPDVDSIDVSYKVDNDKLVITSNQISLFEDIEAGEIYDGGPKLHVFKAAMAVLHGHDYNKKNALNDVSVDIMKTWKQRRRLGGGMGFSSPALGQGNKSFARQGGLISSALATMGL